MQSEVVCVNFCGVGVAAQRVGQRRLRKSMGLYGAILVHERLRVAYNCAGQ